jgi:hypothetical protein
MTPAITLWLAFVLAAGTICWFAPRTAYPFVIVAALCLPASFTTLGHATPYAPPPGHYTVLGARIDVDVAIWVLLDDGQGGAPRYYKLPYSTATANKLQKAQDMAVGNGGTVGAQIGEDGSPGFAEEGGQSEEPKQVETPMLAP